VNIQEIFWTDVV